MASPEKLLFLESFWLESGTAVLPEVHLKRFAETVSKLAPELEPELEPFLKHVSAHLQQFTGFPRLECLEKNNIRHLKLNERSQMPQYDRAAVAIGNVGDGRKQPEIKGADLDYCLNLVAQAQHVNCDEMLILDHDGNVLESTFSAIVWWEKDALCAVRPSSPVLASVTRYWLLTAATEQAINVSEKRISVDELKKKETWLLNARHGIRPVVRWNTEPAIEPDWQRYHCWQKAWENSRVRLNCTAQKIDRNTS